MSFENGKIKTVSNLISVGGLPAMKPITEVGLCRDRFGYANNNGNSFSYELGVTLASETNRSCCYKQFANSYSTGTVRIYSAIGNGTHIPPTGYYEKITPSTVDKITPLYVDAYKNQYIVTTFRATGLKEIGDTGGVDCSDEHPFRIYYDEKKDASGKITYSLLKNGSGKAGVDKEGVTWCKQTFRVPKSAVYHLVPYGATCLLVDGPLPKSLFEWGVEVK